MLLTDGQMPLFLTFRFPHPELFSAKYLVPHRGHPPNDMNLGLRY